MFSSSDASITYMHCDILNGEEGAGYCFVVVVVVCNACAFRRSLFTLPLGVNGKLLSVTVVHTGHLRNYFEFSEILICACLYCS